MPIPSAEQVYRMMTRIVAPFSVVTVFYAFFVYGLFLDVPGAVIQPFVQYATVVAYLFWIAALLRLKRSRLRSAMPDALLAVVVVFRIVPLPVGSTIIALRLLGLVAVQSFARIGGIALTGKIRLNPARVLLISFIGVIAAGTFLLLLPAATADGRGTPLVDALFTATSATCVTGLIVHDTGSYFSLFGQLVILSLIQVGGLGIMTFSTLFAMMIGKRLGLREEEHLRGILDQRSSVEMYRLVLRIVNITVLFELVGALILYVRFLFTDDAPHALYRAVFHAISAFCNAGFSLNADSLTPYAGDIVIMAVMSLLIVTGGLGFIVMSDIMKNMRRQAPLAHLWRQLTVHTKMVFVTTFVLLCVGTLSVFFFEFDNTMLGLSAGDKLLAAFFQSVTFRTAGFNSIDFSQCRIVTLFIAIILMFIGASPSSTGGGIKTTTFAVLVLSIKSLFQARDKIELYHRTIPAQTVLKAIAILLFFLSFLTVFSVLLLATQTGRFIDIIFEATSALATVGLSTGLTPDLTAPGKLIITLLMYVGRVGPLTVVLAIREPRKVNVAYPETRVGVG